MRTILVTLAVLALACTEEDATWPPVCGMSEAELERHMSVAKPLFEKVMPSDVYDFNGNGAVDSNDLGVLIVATRQCE